MNVIINTDASWCPGNHIAGFAFWIECDNRTAKIAGICKGEVSSSLEAELRAISNALVYLIRNRNIIDQVQRITVYTDCTFAIDRAKGTAKQYKNKIEGCLGDFIQFIGLGLKLRGIQYEYKYIEAHKYKRNSKFDTEHHYRNEWCDTFAYSNLVIARKRAHQVRMQKPLINLKAFTHGSNEKQRIKTLKAIL